MWNLGRGGLTVMLYPDFLTYWGVSTPNFHIVQDSTVIPFCLLSQHIVYIFLHFSMWSYFSLPYNLQLIQVRAQVTLYYFTDSVISL